MTRPTGRLLLALLATAGGTAAAGDPPPAPAGPPRALRPGPHLFLDDHLVASSDGLVRRVNAPPRFLPGPVVTGKEDGNFQPYVSVVRDPATRRFRMWYGAAVNEAQSRLGAIESDDGIAWKRPSRILDDPEGARIRFGASVIDAGPAAPDPARRFLFAWYWGELSEGGLMIAASSDGLSWKPLAPGPVLKHNHDINNLFRDPIRGRYVATVNALETGSGWTGVRRVVRQSVTSDLLRWPEPRLVIAPDARDEGETQFYCMGGLMARGELLIGMVRVLRDDLPADPGGPVKGIGYTTLAWSRDGERWTRDREPFLNRSPSAGAWDHAMAWIDGALPVDDEVFFYYGGYARGHKVERFTERQIGLVRMPRDRYAAREAGEAAGTLRTPVLTLEAREMTVNADARGGEVRVQVTDAAGQALPGYAFADHAPVTADAVAAPVRWKKPIGDLKGRPVRLAFSVRRARLYGFDLND